jgi:hypothetical protein
VRESSKRSPRGTKQIFDDVSVTFGTQNQRLQAAAAAAALGLHRSPSVQTVIEEIPETSWAWVDFPKELCGLIVDASGGLPSTGRVKYVLLRGARFSNERVGEQSRQDSLLKSDAAGRDSAVDLFLGGISAALKLRG